MKKATFGAGCFWHVEADFFKVKGVKKTIVGYMGGTIKNPTYEDVCTNKTRYIEVVQAEFDPKLVSYEKLLETFWKIHNPTSFDKQGFDIGTQYKSVIFYHNEKQKDTAMKSKIKHEKDFKKQIVTEIRKASKFYKAEEYHQKYLEKRGMAICRI